MGLDEELVVDIQPVCGVVASAVMLFQRVQRFLENAKCNQCSRCCGLLWVCVFAILCILWPFVVGRNTTAVMADLMDFPLLWMCGKLQLRFAKKWLLWDIGLSLSLVKMLIRHAKKRQQQPHVPNVKWSLCAIQFKRTTQCQGYMCSRFYFLLLWLLVRNVKITTVWGRLQGWMNGHVCE